MKIVCFSDLHMAYDKERDIKTIQLCSDVCADYHPDVVIISGDIFEDEGLGINAYKFLFKLFQGITVICCLGNHEFAGNNPHHVLKHYRENYRPKKHNVHYLDVIGSYKIGNVNFVGNVFWYDGSMKDLHGQKIENWNDYGWIDGHILTWKDTWLDWHNKCVNQILENRVDGMTNVLVTHTVPHRDLNLHGVKTSPYNAYSGVADFLCKHKFDYSVSGHTHRRTIGKEINGCLCVNVGNDFNEFKYFVLEV